MNVVIYPDRPEIRGVDKRFWIWSKSRDEMEAIIPVVYSLKLVECQDFTVSSNAVQFRTEEHLVLFLLKYNPVDFF